MSSSNEYRERFRLRELVPVLVELLDGIGDVVDVGFGSEQHVLTEPDSLLAKLVVVGVVKLPAILVQPRLRETPFEVLGIQEDFDQVVLVLRAIAA